MAVGLLGSLLPVIHGAEAEPIAGIGDAAPPFELLDDQSHNWSRSEHLRPAISPKWLRIATDEASY